MRLDGAGKRDIRSQFAALPFRRRKSGLEILLISSLDTGRWIIPKGWPIHDMTPAAAAAQEAWEEAGITGVVSETCAGFFSYHKSMPDKRQVPVVVAVFPLEVHKLERDFPESGDRKIKWFSQTKASARLEEPELQKILRNFSPGKYL
ncbi:NUDIX hydrolase [Nioella nitratireducens]|uniref:NUDIX hydrolase n=1 Tax=Nioella nitratireducens TaxID=1287720 RepID=UPI001F1ECA91|nr:NUDIX hydrolase [Nioella nitratireducens]